MGLEKKYQSRKAISVSEIPYVFGTLNMEVGCMMDFGLLCFRFLTAPGHLPWNIVFSHLWASTYAVSSVPEHDLQPFPLIYSNSMAF